MRLPQRLEHGHCQNRWRSLNLSTPQLPTKPTMNIEITQHQGQTLAEVTSASIQNPQEALEILINCAYSGAEKIIIHADQLMPDFFDLKTGIAGEILQKVSTYQLRLAIVGDFSQYSSKSLRDFIFESNKVGRINFVASVEEAKEKLCA